MPRHLDDPTDKQLASLLVADGRSTLKNLADTHSWTGHGLHADGDPGGNHPPSCNIVLQLEGTKYVRVAPEERGTFECDPSWVAPVTGVPALAAAMIDDNRISQQYATGG